MKRILSALLFFCMMLTMLPMVYAEEETPITVYVNGEQLLFDVNPITENDRTLVPMRFIFEALGAAVDWDNDTNTATAVKDDITIQITIDDTAMIKNETKVALDVPARLVEDRTLVPIRAVSEGLGAKVDWEEETKRVLITLQEDEPEPDKNPEPTSQPEENETYDYHFDELSEQDMQALQKRYNNLIRYDFEQKYLPSCVLQNNEELILDIRAKSDFVKEYVKDVWNQVVALNILQVQLESESIYALDEDLDVMMEGYLSIMKEAGLEASNYFDCSYETLKDGSVMLLVTFEETDTLMACKFLGIVVRPDDTVRYFTSETDILDKEHLYFCEVTLSSRGTYGTTGFTKEEFIQAAESVLET